MLSSKKRAKKTLRAGKIFQAFKPFEHNKTPAPPVSKGTRDAKQERLRRDPQKQDNGRQEEMRHKLKSGKEESEQFDPQLVRMSVREGDDWDGFSLDDMNDYNEDSSSDGSMYTEEEKRQILVNHRIRNTSQGEVATVQEPFEENQSSDSDQEYDDMNAKESESCRDGNYSQEIHLMQDDASGESEQEDAFDADKEMTFQSKNRHSHAGGEKDVTNSVISYTTGGSLAVSINQINLIMKSSQKQIIQNPDDPPLVDHEDSEALINQLNCALRPSIVQVEETPLKATKDLESELELELDKSDSLQRELEESEAKCVDLEQRLNNSKAKMLELEEIGEQVHLARGFALQSVKIQPVSLKNHQNAAQGQTRSNLDQLLVCEEEASDESDNNSSTPWGVLVDDDDNQCERMLYSTGGVPDETARSRRVIQPSLHEDDLVHEVATTSTFFNNSKMERSYDNDTFERSTKFNDSNAKQKSPEEKLRSSLQKARMMEEVGEYIRDSILQEVASVDVEVTDQVKVGLTSADVDNISSSNSEMLSAEIVELRARLREQELQIESLEQARAYDASKVAELTDLIQRSSPDDLLHHLAEKSVQVAELRHEVSLLQEELERATNRSTVLEAERDANKTVIANLSKSMMQSGPLCNSAKAEHGSVYHLMKQGGVIPANNAIELTIASLQKTIEALEDEKAAYKDTVDRLTSSVIELTQENDAKSRQVAALESQFLMLNKRSQGRIVLPVPSDHPSPPNKEKLVRFKAWATNKINMAHEQFENIKSDIEIRRVTTNPDQVLT